MGIFLVIIRPGDHHYLLVALHLDEGIVVIASQVIGMIVTSPTPSGSKTRLHRWAMSDFNPRLRHSMAVKKPLIRKNNGMRKP